jgi:hypothetical protein
MYFQVKVTSKSTVERWLLACGVVSQRSFRCKCLWRCWSKRDCKRLQTEASSFLQYLAGIRDRVSICLVYTEEDIASFACNPAFTELCGSLTGRQLACAIALRDLVPLPGPRWIVFAMAFFHAWICSKDSHATMQKQTIVFMNRCRNHDFTSSENCRGFHVESFRCFHTSFLEEKQG